MYHNQRKHAVIFAGVLQNMAGLAAKSGEIVGSAGIGSQYGEHIAALQLGQRFFGA